MMQAAANSTAGLISLGIFVIFWLLVVISLLRKGAREEAQQHAQIPFKEVSHD
jgi:cbb3-type cytochrome oxidase subunit 3